MLWVLLFPGVADAAADCGTGADSPPAIFMPSGKTCAGSMQGEPYTFNGFVCGWFCAIDNYTYSATLDDAVRIGFNPANCARWNTDTPGAGGGSYTSKNFVSGGTGTYNLWPYASAGFDGGGCADTQSGYSISVVVIPNTRPTLVVGPQPTTALPADPVSFTFGATDPEANLTRLGLRRLFPSLPVEWATPDAAGNATLTTNFLAGTNVEFSAEDVHGARANTVLHYVTLVEDDCATGGDVVVHPLALGTLCQAHLARALSDDIDSFDVVVGASTPRLLVSYQRTSGNLETNLKLHSPSGAVLSVASGDRIVAEPGTWRLDVERVAHGPAVGNDDSVGGYLAGLLPFPAAAPPVLTATAEQTTVRHLENARLTFSATEANGLGVRYLVDWGDGTSVTIPSTGFAAPGAAQTAQHSYYPDDPASPLITITATNEDGLTDVETIPISVVKTVDRCDGLGTAVDDSPNSRSGFTDAHRAAYQSRPPMHCTGELGYFIRQSEFVWATDGADAFAFSTCLGTEGCGDIPSRYRITLSTANGLRARILVRLGAAGLQSATVDSGGTATLEVPVVPGLIYDVEISRVLDVRGTYTLDIESVPGAV